VHYSGEKQDMSKLNFLIAVIFGLLLCAGTSQAQQWTNLGAPPSKVVNPNCPATVFPCYTPANTTPQLRDWMKATYDTLDKGVVIYANSPYCCVDAANAVFVLNTANAIAKGSVNVSDGTVWMLKWSNNDRMQNASAAVPITSISRTSNVVTVNLASPGTRTRVGEYVVVMNVSDPSFNGTFKIASAPNPPETTFTYNQVGPDAGPIVNSGKAGGPTDGPNQPSDREPYHQITWDSKRNYLWQFGGDAYGVNNPGKQYCADCQATDLYKFDFTQANPPATQVCGNFTAPCGPPAVDEGAIVYDPANDVIVWFGGLVLGVQVNDTWEYKISTNTWTHTCSATSCTGGGTPPPIRNREALIYNPTVGAVIMFGGLGFAGPGKGGVILNDTWAYSTNTHKWTQLTSQFNPTGTMFPVMDYNPDRLGIDYVTPDAPAQVWELTNINVGAGTASWANLNMPPGPTLGIPANDYGAYDQNAHQFVTFLNNNGWQVWTLNIGGGGGQGGVLVSPGSLNIPTCTYCVTLTSNGTAPLFISSIKINGTNAADFSQVNNCGTSLQVGSSCSISVTYNASIGGTETGTLVISDNAPDSPQTVTLTGTGSPVH
jgi:Galactose oxidase, central domain